jgi:hypothetical protein
MLKKAQFEKLMEPGSIGRVRTRNLKIGGQEHLKIEGQALVIKY